MRKTLVITGILCLVSLTGGVVVDARACSIDGIPSISANGRLAVLNRPATSAKVFLSWSPFLFKQSFREGALVRLSEDRAKLKGVLSPEGLRAHWRWVFGDGQSAIGAATTAHRYKKPGQYRVVVAAYYPSFKAWLTFDSVTLTVRA